RRRRVHVPVQFLRPPGGERPRRIHRRGVARRSADRRAAPPRRPRVAGRVRVRAGTALERSLARARRVTSTNQFQIGGVTVAPNVVLAPMSGITDSAYRSVVKEQNPGAVGLVVTELVSIEALTRQNA